MNPWGYTIVVLLIVALFGVLIYEVLRSDVHCDKVIPVGKVIILDDCHHDVD